ncbi:MAG TPA: hypothetical protein VMY15_08125 [Candidatus Latescibacteria bacterium]|nr:hypothetical protein [Candidatus Latescibacterota bacterium]
MKSVKTPTLVIGLLFLAACSTYKSKPQLHYYHGKNVPEGYIKILRASPAEIEFQIQVEFTVTQMQLYHLVLEGDNPVAEGWFSIRRASTQSYNVTLKPHKGLTFEPGKTYRLCIGMQNPQQVQMTSSNYQCLADYTFVFQEKS